MDSDPLYLLTLYLNFVGMAFSLWFAIYILARSHINHLAFRAVAALLALAFYFYLTFTWIVDPTTDNEALRSLAIVIALVAAHDLTHYLLPEQRRRRLYWLARGIVLFAVVIIVLLFIVPTGEECDPRYTCPVQMLTLWSAVDLFKLLVFLSILYNLWEIRKSGGWVQNMEFYLGVLLAASTIGYGFFGVLINRELPRIISTMLVLCALVLLGYSVARRQSLVTRRTTHYDFLITLATIGGILAIYILIGWQMGLSPALMILLSVLVIFTHSAYDFVRDVLDRLFRSQEREMRRELRDMGQDTFGETTLQRYLSRGLAVLCHNLGACCGFVAVRRRDSGDRKFVYEVMTSYHSLSVGTMLPPQEIVIDEPVQPHGYLAEDIEWLAPAYGGGEQIALVGIGPSKGQRVYSDEDLYWLEDIADEIGAMIYSHNISSAPSSVEVADRNGEHRKSERDDAAIEHLLSTLAFKPDPEMIKLVEDGFRNIHDYSKLGRSPLVSVFDVHGGDHIERGKQVQQKLMEILDKLRPQGDPPSEPLPREWYSYTILYDAYVEESPARDIMGKLYISEGTYYRTRRRALRGVTRALLELGAVT
jgi:hypothetical protein